MKKRKKIGTTIWVSPKIKKRLKFIGKKGETFEDIIKKLLKGK